MNKEVKFSRFVGIAIVIICSCIVVLALMSAVQKNENNDNIIYVDEGSGEILGIPKSNIISNNIDIEKDITIENDFVKLKVKLPKINISTDVANSINDKIYAIYQAAYADILEIQDIQKIYIDYEYKYENNDTVVEITVISKITARNKIEETKNIFIYDIKNNKEVIK